MNPDQFWQIIAATRAETQEQQTDLFWQELEKLSKQDLLEFRVFFKDFHAAAYSWDLWVVAWLHDCSCTDDAFNDFRWWLISRGRTAYELALANPDFLAELLSGSIETEFELFGYVPGNVWEENCGDEPDEIDVPYPKEPTGGDWLRPELKNRTRSKSLNFCVVFDEIGPVEFEAIQKQFPKAWHLWGKRLS